MGELLQPDSVINITGLIQFGEKLSYILTPLASQNYLLFYVLFYFENKINVTKKKKRKKKNYLLKCISVKLLYQFLYLVYGYLFFRCLEKVFKEERNKNKEEISRGVTTSQLGQLPQKEIGVINFLALTLELLARIPLTLISTSATTDYFQKFNFHGFNLDI